MKIEIRKTRAKQPFRVRYIAQNGELIAASENLPNRGDCLKNIRAMRRLFDAENTKTAAMIYDYTKGKEPLLIEI